MDYAQTTFKDKVNDGTIPYASNVDVIFGYIEGSDKYKGIFTKQPTLTTVNGGILSWKECRMF